MAEHTPREEDDADQRDADKEAKPYETDDTDRNRARTEGLDADKIDEAKKKIKKKPRR